MSAERLARMDWCVDVPDVRDYSLGHDAIRELLRPLEPLASPAAQVDLRNYCSTAPDGVTVASAALAVAGLVEYFERRAFGKLEEYSSLFLDIVSRRMSIDRFGSSRSLRCVCKTLRHFGIPPEAAWPLDDDHVDCQPDAFAFAIGRGQAGTLYARLDRKGRQGKKTLKMVRRLLAAGFPCVFGFSMYDCLTASPEIPFPAVFHRLLGGHAVMATGYNDNRRIHSDKGALLVRTNLGSDWGDGGFGWLPYSYVIEGLAADFWMLVSPRWLPSDEFHAPC